MTTGAQVKMQMYVDTQVQDAAELLHRSMVEPRNELYEAVYVRTSGAAFWNTFNQAHNS